jgi:hypothetical protein
VTDEKGTRADFDQTFGFVNGDFPDFNTGWKFANTQYDYLDIPFKVIAKVPSRPPSKPH